jgi:hypothetical protein
LRRRASNHHPAARSVDRSNTIRQTFTAKNFTAIEHLRFYSAASTFFSQTMLTCSPETPPILS